MKRRSCKNSWQPITPHDLRLYLAVLIYCGLVWKLFVHVHYTKYISTQGVPAVMPQQKFIPIEKTFTFDRHD